MSASVSGGVSDIGGVGGNGATVWRARAEPRLDPGQPTRSGSTAAGVAPCEARKNEGAAWRYATGADAASRGATPGRLPGTIARLSGRDTMGLLAQLTRHKSIEQLQQEAGARRDFRRVLGLWQLTAIGIGGIIGVGIFVLAGQQAALNAGPAVALSFVIAGVASAAAALCYAEFAGMIPVTGSAYTYGYAVLGELAAWLIGWDLLLEYALIVSAVASGWSGYVLNLLDAIGIHVPDALRGAPDSGPGHVFNLIAALVALAVAA